MKRTGALLASGRVHQYRSMGAFGKPVYQSHLQLRGMLQGQRQPRLAHYFATPVVDAETDVVNWYAELQGAPRRLPELDAGQAALGTQSLRQIRADLVAFAANLRQRGGGQGGSGAAFATLLEQAMQVPAQGDFLYFIGDQPVIVFWGFEDEAGRSTDPTLAWTAAGAATSPPVAPTGAASAVSTATVAHEPALAMIATEQTRRGGLRWGWALGLLALLGILAAGWALQGGGAAVPRGDPESLATAGLQAEQALEIPVGALERSDLSFLEGRWQLGADRLEEYRDGPANVVGSGRNVLDFKRDGSGNGFFLERSRHAKGGETGGSPYPTCSGAAQASTDGKVLTIVQQECVVRTGQGDGMGSSRAECRRTPDGMTLCENVNTADHHRWRAELRRLPAKP